MGTYVEYLLCPSDGPIAQILELREPFSRGYLELDADERDEDVSALLADLERRGASALQTLAPSRHRAIDRLVAELYAWRGDFDVGPANLVTSMLGSRHYQRVHDDLKDRLEPEVAALLKTISTGRPIAPPGRSTPYLALDGACWVSWWTLAEVRRLRAGIPPGARASTEAAESALGALRDVLEVADVYGAGLVITAY